MRAERLKTPWSDPVEIILLGTGSPNPSLRRQSSGYLVEVAGQTLVFDHGDGAHQRLLEAGKRAVDVDRLFLSHLHSDHCLDYARLVHTRWDQAAGARPELIVHGPAYTARMTDLLFGPDGVFEPDLAARTQYPGSLAVFEARGGTLPRERPKPDVRALADGQTITGDGWTVTAREVRHQHPYLECYGFRLECADGVFVYSGDTGPCDGIEALAEGADVLIHMCNYVSGTALNDGMRAGSSGHMDIAELAARRNVKTLVATHFTPQMEPPGVKEMMLGQMAEVFKGRIVWGEDLMRIPLRAAALEKPV